LDEWLKEIAPSNELRQWFHQNPSYREEFRERYLAELARHGEKLQRLARIAETGQLTLVYSSRNEDFNNATVLKEHLETLMCR